MFQTNALSPLASALKRLIRLDESAIALRRSLEARRPQRIRPTNDSSDASSSVELWGVKLVLDMEFGEKVLVPAVAMRDRVE